MEANAAAVGGLFEGLAESRVLLAEIGVWVRVGLGLVLCKVAGKLRRHGSADDALAIAETDQLPERSAGRIPCTRRVAIPGATVLLVAPERPAGELCQVIAPAVVAAVRVAGEAAELLLPVSAPAVDFIGAARKIRVHLELGPAVVVAQVSVLIEGLAAVRFLEAAVPRDIEAH